MKEIQTYIFFPQGRNKFRTYVVGVASGICLLPINYITRMGCTNDISLTVMHGGATCLSGPQG